jgi:alkyldihydroxyacetonephosphate synthase
MRWWGWGEDGHDHPVPPAAEAMLARLCGMGSERRDAVPIERVTLPEPRLAASARELLAEIVGAGNLRDDRLARVTHAVGKSYPDLIRIRSGDGAGAPDAVVYPAGHDEVAAVLAACSAEGVAVVPFGGGTSVVGGVEALRGTHEAVIAVDLARVEGLVATDATALTATVRAGTTGPALERMLCQHGLMLGHLPQSFEFSTVGGWIAARSAGQASTGYGRVDERLIGLRCATPAGTLVARPVPASAAGPDLRQLVLGSEGALGVVTEATLAVSRVPAIQRFEGYALGSFAEGVDVLRRLEQAGAAPDVCRLSDEPETAFGIAAIGAAWMRHAFRGYLGARGVRAPCLAIFGFDGSERSVRRRSRRVRALLRRAGAVPLGERPGRQWAKSRFTTPYLRDELVTRGMLVDTLETATTWDRLDRLRGAVEAALRESLGARGTPPYVMCHVSHLYGSGASLYFTYFARQDAGAELEQWRAAKAAASAAIVAGGGTITHHHGIGVDHAPWLAAEAGELWVEVLRAAKRRLDPAGIMNPGKLIAVEAPEAGSAPG